MTSFKLSGLKAIPSAPPVDERWMAFAADGNVSANQTSTRCSRKPITRGLSPVRRPRSPDPAVKVKEAASCMGCAPLRTATRSLRCAALMEARLLDLDGGIGLRGLRTGRKGRG